MVVIIGISGPTSSGKSYFAKKLYKETKMQDISCCYLTTDEFYLDRSTITYEDRTKINFDEPISIDRDEFFNALKQLSLEKDANIPVYDYSLHTRKNDSRLIKVADLIIVEGIFAFSFDEVNDLYNFKIYVAYDPDLRLIRRIARDIQERSRSLDSVIKQHLNTVRPTQSIYVEKDKEKADIIIRGDKNHINLIQMIINSTLYKKKINE